MSLDVKATEQSLDKILDKFGVKLTDDDNQRVNFFEAIVELCEEAYDDGEREGQETGYDEGYADGEAASDE